MLRNKHHKQKDPTDLVLTHSDFKEKPSPLGDNIWMKNYWRPTMAYAYTLICIFDFILAPCMLVAYSIFTKTAYIAWVSLTLSNGGLFHLAMGAILGVSAWTKGQENLLQVAHENAMNTKEINTKIDDPGRILPAADDPTVETPDDKQQDDDQDKGDSPAPTNDITVTVKTPVVMSDDDDK